MAKKGAAKQKASTNRVSDVDRERYGEVIDAFRSTFDEFQLGIADGMVACISAKECNTASEGTCIPGGRRGIGLYDLDFIHVQSELFRNDHRHNGVAALADIVRAGVNNSVAFTVQTDDRGGRAVMRRYQNRESCTGHEAGTGQTDRLAASLRISPSVLPVNCLCAGIHALLEAAGCELQSCRACVVRRDLVLMSEFKGIDAQMVRDFIHVDLMRKMDLAGGISSHGAGSGMVRIRSSRDHVDILYLVRECRADQGKGIGSNTGSAVSTAVQDMSAALCKKLSVFAERGLDLEGDRVSGSGALEDFISLQDALDRVAQPFRELARAELMSENVQLAAEAAAHHWLDQADLRVRNTETPGDPVS